MSGKKQNVALHIFYYKHPVYKDNQVEITNILSTLQFIYKLLSLFPGPGPAKKIWLLIKNVFVFRQNPDGPKNATKNASLYDGRSVG